MTKRSPFRYFKTSPEIIRLAVMLYVRFAALPARRDPRTEGDPHGEPTAKIADLLAAVVPEALPETGVSISFQDSLARTHLSRVCFSLR
jgi:hypothetical protein